MSKKYQAKYQKLTAKLRSARQEAGLTQVEAGKILKKPQAYISKIERGERGVDQNATRQGYRRWWEIDLSYYLLVILNFFGVIWGLRQPAQKTLRALSG